MTIEKRCFVGFKEIIGLELRCEHCRTVQIYPIEDLEQAFPRACAGCSKSFFPIDPENAVESALRTFVSAVRNARAAHKPAMRVEIACPEYRETKP